MLLTFIGLVIFSVVFIFSVSNTKYHILCSILPNPNKTKLKQKSSKTFSSFDCLEIQQMTFLFIFPLNSTRSLTKVLKVMTHVGDSFPQKTGELVPAFGDFMVKSIRVG